MKIIMISARRRYASEQPPEGRLLASRRRVFMIFYPENHENDNAKGGVFLIKLHSFIRKQYYIDCIIAFLLV